MLPVTTGRVSPPRPEVRIDERVSSNVGGHAPVTVAPKEPKRAPRARAGRARPSREGSRADGLATRKRVYDVALALFRKRGFAKTTMRDVAEAAGLSLGAAYYYFPSKDAIVLAYYDSTHEEHAAIARAVFARSSDLSERLRAVFVGKLDVVAKDRKMLGALFRSAGDPDDPLSVFGRRTKEVRDRNVGLFTEALDVPEVPADVREAAGPMLWLAHLALLLALAHDRSSAQTATRAKAEAFVDLVAVLLRLASLPQAAPVRAVAIAKLRDAGLVDPS